ncbi:MAG: formylglycine-generating enzyme family protein [Chloroflexota bacterium]|nr:formylglycine-generating enzyme family protein [Chloroflexota bacterium]
MIRLIAVFIALSLVLAGCASPSAGPPPVAEFDTGIDPDSWATIPAGEFLQGVHNHHREIAADYEMMVTDVTNTQFAAYLNQALADGSLSIGDAGVIGTYPGDEFHGHEHEKEIQAGDWLHFPLHEADSRLTYDGKTFGVIPGYENHPLTMVTWFGAQGYCEYVDGRLPTDLEWEKAARGDGDRAYPWGADIAPANSNFYKSGDPLEGGPNEVGNTTPVGFYNGQAYAGFQTLDSPSPYGLYDMAGNVWQWIGNVYQDTHLRTLRGGGKMDYGYDLRVWKFNSAEPDFFSPSIGFRCARNPAQ